MTTLIRLTIKQRRAEYATMLALVICATVAYGALAAMIAALDLPHCLSVESAATVRCQAASAQWAGLRGVGMAIAYGAAALSAVAGTLVGVTLVAVEIEQRTAFLPWTMGTSRRRWLIERALVLVACCGIPCIVLALTSDVAQQAVGQGEQRSGIDVHRRPVHRLQHLVTPIARGGPRGNICRAPCF